MIGFNALDNFDGHCSLDGVIPLGRDFALRAFAGVGKSFIMHITRLDITALGDLPVHNSSSTILFIKLLHSSLGASVRIIIQKTGLIPPWASTKKQPPSVREILKNASALLLHLIYVTAKSHLCP